MTWGSPAIRHDSGSTRLWFDTTLVRHDSDGYSTPAGASACPKKRFRYRTAGSCPSRCPRTGSSGNGSVWGTGQCGERGCAGNGAVRGGQFGEVDLSWSEWHVPFRRSHHLGRARVDRTSGGRPRFRQQQGHGHPDGSGDGRKEEDGREATEGIGHEPPNLG